MNIPFRYDLPNSHEVNKKISVLNNKLEKLVRVLPHARFIGSAIDRKFFTTHGLHHNKPGKMLVSLQLAEYILTTFAHKFSTSIPLRWFDSDMVLNLHCDSSRSKTQNRNSNRNRKTPITRSKEFLRYLDHNLLDGGDQLNNYSNNKTNTRIKSNNRNVHKNHTHVTNNLLSNTYTDNNLKIFHQNIRGFSNKSDAFLFSLSSDIPHVVCLMAHRL